MTDQISLHRVTAIEQDYAPGDGWCCPSAIRTDVWSWDGTEFTPSGQIPHVS